MADSFAQINLLESHSHPDSLEYWCDDVVVVKCTEYCDGGGGVVVEEEEEEWNGMQWNWVECSGIGWTDGWMDGWNG